MILLKNAFYLAWTDTRARYKKSILGPLWLTLGNLVGVLGLSIVWATLLKEEMRSFVPSLTIGMIIWQLVAGAIGDGPTIFIRQAGMIRNVAIPAWFFVIRALARQIINLLHNLVIVLGVVWYFDFPVQSITWLALPGLLLVIFNLFWIMYFLGMLGARFRDVEYLINALLPLLFFISPVIFRPDRLPVNMEIIWLNPFSYFIEVVRSPFLGHIPDTKNYVVMLGILLAGTIMTLIFQRLCGKRIAFWV
ncbi:ABC transporter permease [Methylomonas paludis]|uniref:ABC transporter permease n=1 Tax=Methylomonas paludis TaxID=1173101 RepID=A0A975MN55_9GAMM|nr:ABC transporter permease [Methylomonas paludis]QWF70867.1 ABC transporter permease [Methylomonas paludis]